MKTILTGLKVLFLILAFLLFYFTATAQLVNEFQKNPDRISIIEAYENQTIIKILGGRYAVIDINYFYIDSTKSTSDGSLYTKYQWAKKEGLIDRAVMNLTEIKIESLKTKEIAVVRYFDILQYNVEFTGRKLRKYEALHQ